MWEQWSDSFVDIRWACGYRGESEGYLDAQGVLDYSTEEAPVIIARCFELYHCNISLPNLLLECL